MLPCCHRAGSFLRQGLPRFGAAAAFALTAGCHHDTGITCESAALPPLRRVDGMPDGPLTVSPPKDTSLAIAREYLALELKPATTCAEFQGFLARYKATVVGGERELNRYVVRFPDSGPKWDTWIHRYSVLNHEPIIEFAVERAIRGSPGVSVK
jgi:hypothetical protein